MGFLKLSSGAYNALDFGIFHQVIANTAHGDFFAMTIHPHIYLGDHVSPFLLVLAALYRIAATPETLVIVQVLAVVLAVWPLYRMTHSLHAGARVVICVSYLFPRLCSMRHCLSLS